MGKKQGQASRMVSPDACATPYEQLLLRRRSAVIPSRRLSMRAQKGRSSIADSSIVDGCDDNAFHHRIDNIGLRNENRLNGLHTHQLHNHRATESAVHTHGALVESHSVQPLSVHDTDVSAPSPPTMAMTIMLQIPPKLSVPNMASVSHLYPSTRSDTGDSVSTMTGDDEVPSSLFVASTDTTLDNDSDSTESDGSNDDDAHASQDDSDSDDDVPLALRLIDQPITSVSATDAPSAHACTADQTPPRSSPPIRRRLPPSLHPFNNPVPTKHRSSSVINTDISPQLFSSALNGRQAAEIMTSIRQRKREHRDKSGMSDTMDETFPSQSSAPTNSTQRHAARRRRNGCTVSPLIVTAITNAAVAAMTISDISTDSPSQCIIDNRLRACIERKRKRVRRASEGTSPSPKPPPRKHGMSLRDRSDARVEPDTDTPTPHQSQSQTSCDASEPGHSEDGSTVTSDSDHTDPVSINGGVVMSGTYRYPHSSVSVSILRACSPRIVMRTPTSPLSLSAIHQDHRTSNDSDQTLVNTSTNQPAPRKSTDIKRQSSSVHQPRRSSITKLQVPVSLQSSKRKSKWKPSFWSISVLPFKSTFSGRSSSVLPPWSEVTQSAFSVSSSVSDAPSLQHRSSRQLNDVQHMPPRHAPPRPVRHKRSSSLNAPKRLSLSVPVSSVSVMSTIVSPISPTESDLVAPPSTPVSAHGTDNKLTHAPHGMATWLQPPVTPGAIHGVLIEVKRRMGHDANHRPSINDHHRDALDLGDTKHLQPVSTPPPLVPLSHTMNPGQHEKQHASMFKSRTVPGPRQRSSSLHKPWFMVDGSLSTPMPPLPPSAASRHHQTPTASSEHTNTGHASIKPSASVPNLQSSKPVKGVPVRATRSLSITSLRPMHKLDISMTPPSSPKSKSLPSPFRRNTTNSFTNGHIVSRIKSVFSSPVSPSDSSQPHRSKTVLPPHICISTPDQTESLLTLNSSSSTLLPIDMQYLCIDDAGTDRPSSTETVCTIHSTETLTNADTEDQWFVKPLPIVLMDNAGHVTDTDPSYIDLSDHHKLDTLYDLMTPSVHVFGLEDEIMDVLDAALTSTNT